MFKSLLPWKHTKTKVVVLQRTMEDDELVLQKQELVPCNTCGRTFLPQPLKKHAPICEKTLRRKRKVFDSLKQRVEGTDLAQFHQRTFMKKQPEVTPKQSETKIKRHSTWEENHLELVKAIRSAKGASKNMSATRPTSKKSSTLVVIPSQNERCPFCERNFGHKAFDRHVEWCKEHSSRIQKSPANVVQAKERLEARTKYKVPPLRQSKRSMIREKYSSLNTSKIESATSVQSSASSLRARNASVRKPKSLVDVGRSAGDHGRIETVKQKSEPVQRLQKKSVEKVKECVQSLRGKMSLPREKTNTIRVNEASDCMTVSPIKPKAKLVTWKDLSGGNKQKDCQWIEERPVTIFYENPNVFSQNDDDGTVHGSGGSTSGEEMTKTVDLDDVFNFEQLTCLEMKEIKSLMSHDISTSSDSDLCMPSQRPNLAESYRKMLRTASNCSKTETSLDGATIDDTLSVEGINAIVQASASSSSNVSLVDLDETEDDHVPDKVDNVVFYFSKSCESNSSASSKASSRKEFNGLALDLGNFSKEFVCFKNAEDHQIPKKRLKLVDNTGNDPPDIKNETESIETIMNSTFTVGDDEKTYFLPEIVVKASHLSNIPETDEKDDKIPLKLPVLCGGVTKIDIASKSFRERLISKSEYNPFECAERQFRELFESDDFIRPKTTPSLLSSSSSSSLSQKNVPSIRIERTSVIEPPRTFQDVIDQSEDDFEMLESQLNDSFIENDSDKMTRKYSDDVSSIDSNLINENDNLTIPEHLQLDNYSPTSTEDTDSTIQNDEFDKDIAQVEKSTPIKQLSVKTKSDSSSAKSTNELKKNLMKFEALPKPPPPLMKNRDDVNNYFQRQKSKSPDGDDDHDHDDVIVVDDSFTAEELFAVDDKMYEEYKIFEEMYLKEKESKNSSKKKSKTPLTFGLPLVSDEGDDNLTQPAKICIDSAYGSLNRNTPTKQTNNNNNNNSNNKNTTNYKKKKVRSGSTSSSSSETVQILNLKRQSKFCHECGTKYPVDSAKFCVECGIRRLIL